LKPPLPPSRCHLNRVGYEGGQLEQPSYKDVCTDSTGHAEVVELDFDPQRSASSSCWTPSLPCTTHHLNRQGPDWGTQYRSAVFFHSPEQEEQAKARIEQLTAEAASSQSASSPKSSRRRPSGAGGLPPALPGKARPGKLHI